VNELRDTATDEVFNPEDLEIEVLMSSAGYYIGQLEPCGVPYSRLSGYFKTRDEAEKAMGSQWKSRTGIECEHVYDNLENSGKLKRSGNGR